MRRHGITVEERDIGRAPPDLDEVRALLTAGLPIRALLSERDVRVKEYGWDREEPEVGEAARAIVDEPGLLRRPILLLPDGRVLAGFRREEWERVLGVA